MKRIYIASILCLGCTLFLNAQQKQGVITSSVSPVFPKGQKVMNDNFTGTVYLYPMISADSVNNNDVGNVTFEPGARSKWHLHPAGQILLVTDGIGYYQERGQPKKTLRKGDSIKCPPNIPHWHGASSNTALSHLAITGRQNGGTVWLEAVTDSVYYAGFK